MQFLSIRSEINTKIQEFNKFLNEEYQFEEIDITRKDIYSDTLRGNWGGKHWANLDSFGVYILFGVDESDPKNLGIYIGKASQQFMGYRLWAHFKPHRKNMDYHKMIGEQKFNFLALCTLSARNETCRSLSSSLEEYLIRGAFKSAKLINKVGK